jgi:hypothetical protein
MSFSASISSASTYRIELELLNLPEPPADARISASYVRTFGFPWTVLRELRHGGSVGATPDAALSCRLRAAQNATW